VPAFPNELLQEMLVAEKDEVRGRCRMLNIAIAQSGAGISFSSPPRPDRLRVPSSLLSNGYREKSGRG
jgi:hypothetical protein